MCASSQASASGRSAKVIAGPGAWRWAGRARVERRAPPSGGGAAAAGRLGRRAGEGHQRRVHLVEDDGSVDYALRDVRPAGEVVHDLEQDLLEDGPEPAGARAPQEGLLGDGLESVGRELELDVVELEGAPVLLGERVLGLDEDADEGV